MSGYVNRTANKKIKVIQVGEIACICILVQMFVSVNGWIMTVAIGASPLATSKRTVYGGKQTSPVAFTKLTLPNTSACRA